MFLSQIEVLQTSARLHSQRKVKEDLAHFIYYPGQVFEKQILESENKSFLEKNIKLFALATSMCDETQTETF